jgi:hypothetical protein
MLAATGAAAAMGTGVTGKASLLTFGPGIRLSSAER